MTKLLEKKIALITGASKGIGRAVAMKYIDHGAHIIAIARNIKHLESLDDYAKSCDNHITIVPFDLTDFNKIDQLGEIIYKRHGKLDILVSNAAIIDDLTLVSHISQNMWQRIIDTNLTANLRLIRSFDLLLKQSNAGRAIFVTSPLTSSPMEYFGAYAASKAALEILVKTYALENIKTNVKINIVCPHQVSTNLRESVMPGEDQSVLFKPEDIADIFVAIARDNCNISGNIFHTAIKDRANVADF